MSPPVEEWPAHQLQERVYALPSGKRRKGGDIDLTRCPLYELVQYACDPERQPDGSKVIRCEPIVRTFRKCASFMAEVTKLEELQNPAQRP